MGGKRYTRAEAPTASHAGWISPRDPMNSPLTEGNSSFSVLEIYKRLNLGGSHYHQKYIYILMVWGDGYVSLITVMSSQCIHTLDLMYLYIANICTAQIYTISTCQLYQQSLENEKGAKKVIFSPISFPSSSVRFIILSLFLHRTLFLSIEIR